MLCLCTTCFMHRREPVIEPQYVINEPPIAWARAKPNFSKRCMYDSQKDAKLAYGCIAKQQHGNQPLYKGPLHLDALFYLPYAQTERIRKRQEREQYVSTRFDLDNALKFVGDAFNTVLYADDKQIASIYAAKIYSDNPRTEFSITELKDE